MFKAFADETRMRILHLLTQGELCVCDLVEALKLSQPKVSRHLAYLKTSGLVSDRKQGLWRYYSLTPPDGRFHKTLLSCLKTCFAEVEILRHDLESLKKAHKSKCC